MIYLVVANYIQHNFEIHSYVKSLNYFHSGVRAGYGDINVLTAIKLHDIYHKMWDVSEKCVIKSNLNYLTNR
ncbi:MAG: hypothetical protein KDH96_07385 [Candidatus Riesia sp.]|nr:hypothetical protein [Candidatus Riesia sp.]